MHPDGARLPHFLECCCQRAPCADCFSLYLQGIFLLQDHAFRWTRYISGSAGEDQAAISLQYCMVCCGLLRGALAAFDMAYVVHVDVSALPRVVFQARQQVAMPPPVVQPPPVPVPAGAGGAAAAPGSAVAGAPP